MILNLSLSFTIPSTTIKSSFDTIEFNRVDTLFVKFQVTSEIHNFFLTVCHFAFFLFYTGLILRSLSGHLSFWVIFALVETLKMSFVLATGIFNVSSFIQLSIILNFKLTQNYRDRTIIICAIFASCTFLFTSFLDHLLVEKDY